MAFVWLRTADSGRLWNTSSSIQGEKVLCQISDYWRIKDDFFVALAGINFQ
jgi:hypothetical protein